ncbi:glycosyltransferase family 2 protein [Lysinimonas soli]|uniref:Glycosyltransferase family 2 protein n=1 Tax=Lysinimonas soli TaxID=1074233 RepID=A0ABW0NTT4_9MICO
MAAPGLSSTAIVTVSYNSSAHLRPFLESIRASESEQVLVVVADNASDDLDRVEALAREFDARLVRLGENHGYGGAINRAASTLAPEITSILVVNPDVSFLPGSITTLMQTLAANPAAGAVGPRVLNSDGTVYPSARRLPSLRTGVGHALLGRVWPSNPWTRRYLSDAFESSTITPAGWLSGSCVLVRRSAFDAIGGFDENFFMYFEDVDLGYRLGKANWLSLYDPAATVVHTGAHSTSSESRRMLEVHHQSAYRYLQKKYSALYLAPLRLALRIGLAIRSKAQVARAERATRKAR